MKYRITSVTRVLVDLSEPPGPPNLVPKRRVLVELDEELAVILGRDDMLVLLERRLTYDFGEFMSEAAMASAVHSDVKSRKHRASLNPVPQGLVGKEFEV